MFHQTLHKCFVTAMWSMVLGLPFSRQDSHSKFDLWLECNRGSFSSGDKFPTPCLDCMQCLSNSCLSDNDNVEEMEETCRNYLTVPTFAEQIPEKNAALRNPILTPDISPRQRDVLPGSNLHLKSKAADLGIRRSTEECIL